MSAMIPKELEDDLELLRSSAVAAGIIAAGYFGRPLKTWEKENASPVSEADMAVDSFLASALCTARPDYGWLSEESADDFERLHTTRQFIVDPIDGTRAFIKGDDNWSVSLAVVENGEAVAGVIYVPACDEMFSAAKGMGATLNGAPLVYKKHSGPGPLIPAPGAVHRELTEAGLDYVKGPYVSSLAYRLVQVATGRVDGAVARRGAQDWDIAAAAVILAECGITLEDVCAGPPVFNRREVRHGALAALANSELRPTVHSALIRVYGCPSEGVDETPKENQAR